MRIATQREEVLRPDAKSGTLERAALLYLGLTLSMPQWTTFETVYLSSSLLVALLLAMRGWRVAIRSRYVGGYLPWAGILVVSALLSSIHLWTGDAVYWSATFAVWLLFIIPGLAGTLRIPTNRSMLVAGLAIGAAIYGGVAVWRLLTGESILDGQGRFLGQNRNNVSVRVFFALPLVALDLCPLPRRIRMAVGALCLVWLFTSGGRSGLVGLAGAVFVYVVLQPDVGRRLRVAAAVISTGLVLAGTIAPVGGPLSDSMNRLLGTFEGEKSASDERRELAFRRAWHLGWENPWFGIGHNQVQGRHHPVLEEAPSVRVYRSTLEGGTHNLFLQLFASIGIGALIGSVGIFVFLLRTSLRHRHVKSVVAVGSAIGGSWLMLYFLTFGSDLWLVSMALGIGVFMPEEMKIDRRLGSSRRARLLPS